MAGFDNEVLFCTGERLLPSTTQAISLMQQTSTDVARVNYTGNPNSNVSANPGSLCHDPVSGNVYFKQTGTGNTGWVIFQSAVSTANATPQFSSGVLDFGLSNLLLGNNGVTISSGIANVGYGKDALDTVSSADACTAVGFQALKNTNTSGNTAIGYLSLNLSTLGGQNLAAGYRSLASSVEGVANTALGFNSLSTLGVSGNTNTAVGSSSATSLASGSGNVCIGYNSGSNYSSSESNNIVISHVGVAAESNKIRIGTSGTQNACFVAGITGVTVSGSAPIGVDTNGQMSSLGFGTSGQILTSNGAATSPTWQNSFYQITVACSSSVLVALSTYYMGFGQAFNTTAIASTKFVITRSGNIKTTYALATNEGTLSSSELATLKISINGASGTTIFNNIDFSTINTSYSNTGLNIAVTAGDYIQFELDTPAWTIAPTSVVMSISISIQ